MNSSVEQESAVDRPRSADTRRRLLAAAADLIGEAGWARVTTRAVAARARLPLGAVTYHFRGKQDLLTQAALEAVEDVFPVAELAATRTLADLLAAMRASLDDHGASDPKLTGVLMETMRESTRDPVVRERMAFLLSEYRRLLTRLVRDEQERGTLAPKVDPAAVATLVAAAGDGLLLHALLAPDLDVTKAAEALFELLGHAGRSGAPR